MQALWAEPHVTVKGKWHTIDDAGINPRPAAARVPLWYGGHAEVTLRRVVKWGDGWMPLAYGPGEEARAAFDKLRRLAEEAGRDPATIGIDTRVSAAGTESEWREDVRFWKSCGVTHLTLANYYQSGHLRRIEGRTLADHIAAMQRYRNAVADLL
jgi:alkanesulfonate monooxygenase SsuD/methylene tetrahydromethanopterin reductase-like flavin-dependent oxidoreductase (luciferase family)